MSSGRLGAADLGAATLTTLYLVPASTLATFNVNLCNRTASAIAVRLALSTTDAPAASEYAEYDAEIPAHGVLERTGLVAQAGMRVVAYAASAGVSAMAWGLEEAA